jgi:hypothetical protein
MSSPSHPDWLNALIAQEGDPKPIDARERDALFGALNAAHIPQPLDQGRHREIIEQAIAANREAADSVDPLAPASSEELTAAAKLRDSLDTNQLVRSLRAAYLPGPPQDSVEAPLRNVAIAKRPEREATRRRRVTGPVWGFFAAAAAVVLWFIAQSNGIGGETQYYRLKTNTLAQSRSTESLFAKPFAQSTNSERIDKIALVRSRELRNNRYAIWGLP